MDFAGPCPTIYGPVDSRRFGHSLGVNVGETESKICTWGCVYCQCGFGERRDFTNEEVRSTGAEIVSQIRKTLMERSSGSKPIDFITFAGNTEPFTHPDIGFVLKELKKLQIASRATWKVNVLSNGSELGRPETLPAFRWVDDVWLKLDCVDEEKFQRLNRPLSRIGGIQGHIENLKKVKTLKLQSLLWTAEDPKLSNSDDESLSSLREAFRSLQPAEIHLLTIERAPAMTQVKPLSTDLLETFAQILRGDGLKVSVFPPRD